MSDVDLTHGLGTVIAIFLAFVFILLVVPAGIWAAAKLGVRMSAGLRSTAKGFTLFFSTLLALFVLYLVCFVR